jgi:hypothetical protein
MTIHFITTAKDSNLRILFYQNLNELKKPVSTMNILRFRKIEGIGKVSQISRIVFICAKKSTQKTNIRDLRGYKGTRTAIQRSEQYYKYRGLAQNLFFDVAIRPDRF